jgi:hypothetical protein
VGLFHPLLYAGLSRRFHNVPSIPGTKVRLKDRKLNPFAKVRKRLGQLHTATIILYVMAYRLKHRFLPAKFVGAISFSVHDSLLQPLGLTAEELAKIGLAFIVRGGHGARNKSFVFGKVALARNIFNVYAPGSSVKEEILLVKYVE